MPKRIRNHPIYLAPRILGFYNNNDIPVARDEDSNTMLNPNNLDDKIRIYERQVKGWFLDRASALSALPDSNFIVLMICLSYLEGVEQCRSGRNSNGHSRLYFRNSIRRIFPTYNFNDHQLDDLYHEARCGLFHNGMVQGKIILDNLFTPAISFPNQNDIYISPSLLLDAIIADFNSYINELSTNDLLRTNFSRMFTNL